MVRIQNTVGGDGNFSGLPDNLVELGHDGCHFHVLLVVTFYSSARIDETTVGIQVY